jgi:FkbM family methyltransferase
MAVLIGMHIYAALLFAALVSSQHACESSLSDGECRSDKLAGDDGAEITVSLLQSELTLRQAEVRTHVKPRDEGSASSTYEPWTPEMFKGCTHIFIDAGSNRGTHIRKLFEPHKYPGAPYHNLFDLGFGAPAWRNKSSVETGICAFGFEANPAWAETLANISDAYAKQGWRATWFAPVFVSSRSGDSTTFFSNGGENKSSWGASRVRLNKNSTGVPVPNIDLSSFMEMANQYAGPGYRIMKMDIESAEFAVLPKLMEKKLLCKSALDVLTIEWHDHMPFMYPKMKKWFQAERTKRQTLLTDKCGPEEDTWILDFDDESFLDDGMPLP